MSNVINNQQDFAIVFPGQGSQSLGMLSELYLEFKQVQQVFNQASSVLGYDLWDLSQNGPVEKLNQTEYTQPALLAASYAIWSVYQDLVNNNSALRLPKVLAGHSLGEYSALVAAQSIKFEDALKLVAARGRFMQEAVPVGSGAMAAVLGLEPDVIQKVIDQVCANDRDNIIEIANLNAIGQTVIAGTKIGVVQAVEDLKQAGAKIVKLLDVSVPSHCSLMKNAAENLAELLETIEIAAPNIPVIHNYSLDSYQLAEDIKLALVKQLVSPVRWVETILNISKLDIKNIYEFGPGSVLSKLCKRIDKNIIAQAVNMPDDLK